MPKLQVHTKFTLRHDDGTTTDFAPGQHEFTPDLADHWYVKLHTKEPSIDEGGAGANPDDTQALDDLAAELAAEGKRLATLKAELDTREAAIAAREVALSEREAAIAARQEQLDSDAAARASGNGKPGQKKQS